MQFGVNTDRIYQNAERHSTKAARLYAYHEARSGRNLKAERMNASYDELKEQQDDGATLDYYQAILLGLIQGLTAGFSVNCRDGLALAVTSAFTIYRNREVYDPRKTMKFTLATNNFSEASNTAYAYCDITSLTSEFTSLTNFSDWTQYVVIASRSGGVFIKDYWVYKDCIDTGLTYQNGYDVGLCAGKLATLFLDSVL